MTALLGATTVGAQVAPTRELTPHEQAVHVLARLTFGARPGDVERVAAMGVDRWITQQLRPETIADTTLAMTRVPMNGRMPIPRQPSMVLGAASGAVQSSATSARRAQVAELAMQVQLFAELTQNVDQAALGKIVYADVSERQLLEVMVDFWENHFSVFLGKKPAMLALISYEHEVIRPRALGRFRDLLAAVAASPAMLFYLDNTANVADPAWLTTTEWEELQATGIYPTARRADGMNENYARELLELHTLGVDGGYTQDDVIAVARAFTGWQVTTNRETAGFVFRPDLHDAEQKVLLGRTLPAGRGIEDGQDVLGLLARHPSTARFIALKLARRFVSDDPPTALVERAARTFVETDGNIADVVRTIVTSPEFFSRAAFRSKAKTPFELVVSARRALGAPSDTTVSVAAVVSQLGQPAFGRLSPDGWPDIASAWINSGTMYQRVRFANEVAADKIPGVPTYHWVGWSPLSTAPREEQVQGVVRLLLGGIASPATLAALRDTTLAAEPPEQGVTVPSLRQLIALALASPDFQRR